MENKFKFCDLPLNQKRKSAFESSVVVMTKMMHLADKTKMKRAAANSQILVTLSKSF